MVEFEYNCGLQIIKDLVKNDPNLSRIYGFILYTDADPFVAKVLRDVDYWNEFDHVSGRNWPIFAVRPLQQGNNNINWNEPEDNLLILRDFGLDDSQELPLFVLFMWDDDNHLQEITVPICGNNVEEVHKSLRDIIDVVSGVVKKASPEERRSEKIFEDVDSELKVLKYKTKFFNLGRIIQRYSEFLKMFLMI